MLTRDASKLAYRTGRHMDHLLVAKMIRNKDEVRCSAMVNAIIQVSHMQQGASTRDEAERSCNLREFESLEDGFSCPVDVATQRHGTRTRLTFTSQQR